MILTLLNVCSLVMCVWVLILKVKAFNKYWYKENTETHLLRIIFILFVAVMAGISIAMLVDSRVFISVGVFILSTLSLIINTRP